MIFTLQNIGPVTVRLIVAAARSGVRVNDASIRLSNKAGSICTCLRGISNALDSFLGLCYSTSLDAEAGYSRHARSEDRADIGGDSSKIDRCGTPIATEDVAAERIGSDADARETDEDILRPSSIWI